MNTNNRVLPAWMALAAALLSSTSTIAADDDDDDGIFGLPATDTGFYAGASVSYNDHGDLYSANDDGSLSSVSRDDSATGFAIFGGYNLTDNIGLEVGYVDMGEPDFSAVSDGSGVSWVAGNVSTKLEADGWLFSILGHLPVSERMTVFARLGIFAWDTTETFNENSFISVDKNSGSDVQYGAGFDYDVGTEDKWHLRGEIGTGDIDDDGQQVTGVGVSAYREF